MSDTTPEPEDTSGERPRTRQELYDRIRSSSKSQFILEEMVRLGFWGKGTGSPALTEEWVKRRGELTRELGDLMKKQRRFENRDKALNDMRKKRMSEARDRREETKKRREEEREQKALTWQATQARDITYLGDGVSGGLSQGVPAKPERQKKFDAPEFADLIALSSAMGVPIKQLRFLAYNRAVSKTTHYRRFYMPKKTGGKRLISAPMPRLKAAQHWILEHILYKLPVHDAAHGFRPERSIVTNAAAHVGRDLVVNWDLKDFFPTVTYRRVKGLFQSFGYAEQVATVLALICTEPDAEEVELDGERYFVHTSQRHLPQGAPTSPAITNLMCWRFDARMKGTADKLGYTYTRYADDLTFSTSGDSKEHLNKLLWRVRGIVTEEGFHVHPDKLRIMRKGGHQEVTGLTVNEKVGVPREDLRRFRALVHQIERDGPAGKKWNGKGSHMLSCIYGYANFVCMVDPEKGEPIRKRVHDILVKHGWAPEIRYPKKQTSPTRSEPTPNDGSDDEGIPFHHDFSDPPLQPDQSIWDKIKSFWKK